MKKNLILTVIFISGITLSAHAESSPLRLTIGESKLLHVESAKKVAIGNPGVVDVTSVSDQEILISAKSAGNTSLIFISPSGEKETRAIIVSSHNLKKSMVEVGVEIMEIESQSALKAGLSWGSISNSGSSGNPSITSNNVFVSENTPPPLLTVGSLTRQALSASVQLLIERGKAKILAKPKLLAVSGEEASFLAGGEVP